MDIVLLQHIDQFGECGGNEYALFIFNALDPLQKHFLDDQCQIVSQPSFRNLIQIHKYRYKRSLSIGSHQSDDLILDHLDALLDLPLYPHLGDPGNHILICLDILCFQFGPHFSAEFLAAYFYKGSQVGQSNALAAVLGTGDLSDSLGSDVAGCGEGVRSLNHGLADDGSVLQHIFQIYQTAVMHMLGKIIGIMEMNDAFFVSLHNVLGKKEPAGDILADLAGHIISLYAVYYRVLIGIFLKHFFIVAFQKGEDLLVGRIGLSHQLPLIAVGDVVGSQFVGLLLHDLFFYHVLDLFYIGTAVHLAALIGYMISNNMDLAV